MQIREKGDMRGKAIRSQLSSRESLMRAFSLLAGKVLNKGLQSLSNYLCAKVSKFDLASNYILETNEKPRTDEENTIPSALLFYHLAVGLWTACAG